MLSDFQHLLKNWKLVSLVGAVVVSMLTYFAVLKNPMDASTAMAKGYYQHAFTLLLPEAEAGDPVAQNQLGILYYLGMGVEQNQQLASQWFLKSALQKNANAQINMGRQYQNGLGVGIDTMRAYAWYRQARNNKNENAELHMKLITGRAFLSPSQTQRANEIYNSAEDLKPSKEKGGF